MMRNVLAFLLVAGVSAEEATAEETATETKVVVLTKDNYKETLEQYPDGVLVKYYAPWCGHCKKMEPEYNKAADQVAELEVKVALGKVDATVEQDLASEAGIQGYPTLKWCVKSECSEYDGPREADGIVTWIKTMTGPAVKESEPTGEDSVTVVLKAAEAPAWYEEGAKSHRKSVSCYFVKDEAATEASLSLTHKGEAEIKAEAAPADAEAFSKFVKDNLYPFFGELNGETFETYMGRKGTGLVWTLLPMTEENKKEVVEEKRETMTNVAKKAGSKYSVTWTDTHAFAKVLENMFGITEFPKVVVQPEAGDKKVFIYDGEITEEKVNQYLEDVEAGKVERYLKSEPVPETNDAPVKVMVGKTVQSEAFTADKDVMLEVYAPWCGHCQKLEPEYLKIGKKVAKEGLEDILTIAKIDGAANDSPVDSLSWTGFPTIFYIKAGSDTPMKYDGARDAKGIWKWIKKNHSKAAEIKERLAKKKEEATPKKEEEAKPAAEEAKEEQKAEL